jgi:hypothetical protein
MPVDRVQSERARPSSDPGGSPSSALGRLHSDDEICPRIEARQPEFPVSEIGPIETSPPALSTSESCSISLPVPISPEMSRLSERLPTRCHWSSWKREAPMAVRT